MLTVNQIAIINAAALPGRIVPNLFVPRFGIFNVLAFCSVACFALMFAMFGTTSIASVTVFAILYGFFSGACAPSSSSPAMYS